MAQPARKMSSAERKARRHAERAMARKLPEILHCSFCGTSQLKVEKLIAGPRGVFICNECVALCVKVIDGTWTPEAGKRFEPLKRPPDELLELLPSVDFAGEANRDFLQDLVEALRKRKVSWADIGQALGVSRQSAWERFS